MKLFARGSPEAVKYFICKIENGFPLLLLLAYLLLTKSMQANGILL